jgi:hypothetical protein
MNKIIENIKIGLVVVVLLAAFKNHLSRTADHSPKEVQSEVLTEKSATIFAGVGDIEKEDAPEPMPKRSTSASITITFDWYFFFCICFIIAIGAWYIVDWIGNRQQRTDERTFYTNCVESLIEASRTPTDKDVRARAERHRQLLRKYGNEGIEVFEIIYNSDPDYIGESFAKFRIRVGDLSREILSGAMKKAKKDNEERFYRHNVNQNDPTDWERTSYN